MTNIKRILLLLIILINSININSNNIINLFPRLFWDPIVLTLHTFMLYIGM